MNKNLPKILVVLGPTASGKTGLGVALAKQFNGEIISADSRQVYKGMDIGTGKPRGEWQQGKYLVEGVPHYLMDVIKPNQEFSLADFKQQAVAAIQDILSRGKLPIIVGGTGLYIWSIVDNLDIPKVPPSSALRKSLENKPLEELVKLLGQVDPEARKKVDVKNPRRVLRALEVSILSGESFVKQQTKSPPLFEALQIGLDWPRPELYERIKKRVEGMMKMGLLAEAESLAKKYPWTLPSMSGIGYRELGEYLRGEVSLAAAVEQIKRDTRNYAKRQMTWFKRDKRTHWIDGDSRRQSSQLVKTYLGF